MQFAEAEAAEKFRIEGRSEAQCCPPVTGIGRALVKQACRSDVTVAQKSVAMVQQLCQLSVGEPGGRRRESFAGEFGAGTDAFAGAADVSVGACKANTPLK